MAPAAPALAALLALPAQAAIIEVAGSVRTPPLGEAVLDLAFVADDLLAMLSPEEVSLHRLDGPRLLPRGRIALPGPRARVRSPGGTLLVSERDATLWALSSRRPRALLVSLDRFTARAEAEAVPWPGAPQGLRYRPGSNLIEGALPGLGDGPFLAVDPAEGGIAVSAEGALRFAGTQPETALRVGPTPAPLWRGVLASSSAAPPGSDDAIVLVAREDTSLRVVHRIPVDGAVRALAARAWAETGRLVAAVETAQGGTHLLAIQLRRRAGP